MPSYPGQREFAGRQLHTVDYRRPQEFAGLRVLIVGGGNSAAQILAELSTAAETTWVTRRPPRFLPDDVDGRVLFDVATRIRLRPLSMCWSAEVIAFRTASPPTSLESGFQQVVNPVIGR